jgi:hypothetical protein
MPWIIENLDKTITEIVPNQVVRITLPPEPERAVRIPGVRGGKKIIPAQDGPQTIQWPASAVLSWSEKEKEKHGVHFVDAPKIPVGFTEIGHEIVRTENGFEYRWNLVPISKEDLKVPLHSQAKTIRDNLSRRYEYRPSEGDQPLIVQIDDQSLSKLHTRAMNFLIGKEGSTEWTMFDNRTVSIPRDVFLDMVSKIDEHLNKVHLMYRKVRNMIDTGEVTTYDAILAEMTKDG